MFRLFNRRIDRIQFAVQGWNLIEDDSNLKVWENSSYDRLHLAYFDAPPDIPSPTDLDGLRHFYRTLAIERSGGLIKVDVINVQGFTVVECIVKFLETFQPVTYVGSLTIPFAKSSYVIRFQITETGITGIREATIRYLVDTGEVAGKNDLAGFDNWFRDPYDATVREGALMNFAEQEQFDSRFPGHPLTRVRSHLRRAGETLKFDRKLLKLDGFAQVTIVI